jgi:hypothetical protein
VIHAVAEPKERSEIVGATISRSALLGQRTREIEVIRASGQLRADGSAFSITVRAAVRAENLQRAVESAAKRYPDLTAGLRFPLDA